MYLKCVGDESCAMIQIRLGIRVCYGYLCEGCSHESVRRIVKGYTLLYIRARAREEMSEKVCEGCVREI